VILHKATSIQTEKQNYVFIVCKLGKSSFESHKAEVRNGIAIFSNFCFSSVIHLEKGSKGFEDKHFSLKIKELKDVCVYYFSIFFFLFFTLFYIIFFFKSLLAFFIHLFIHSCFFFPLSLKINPFIGRKT